MTADRSVVGHGTRQYRRGARTATIRAAILSALADGEARNRAELEEATGSAWRDLSTP